MLVADLHVVLMIFSQHESKQMLDDSNNSFGDKNLSQNFIAQQAKDKSLISKYTRKDKAYKFMKNARGSPPHHQRTFYELLAMIRQLETPTWFTTLSYQLQIGNGQM